MFWGNWCLKGCREPEEIQALEGGNIGNLGEQEAPLHATTDCKQFSGTYLPYPIPANALNQRWNLLNLGSIKTGKDHLKSNDSMKQTLASTSQVRCNLGESCRLG